jgi:predicted aminopeptidase
MNRIANAPRRFFISLSASLSAVTPGSDFLPYGPGQCQRGDVQGAHRLEPVVDCVRLLRAVGLVVLVWASYGCESVQFYRQAIVGQNELLARRQPIERLVAAPETDATLRSQLIQAMAIVEFARHQLTLDDGHQFTSFVRIDRPYVVWNVFASEEFSTRPNQWCYLIIGCASYRGYFHEKAARELARRLTARGYDVAVGGVAAYSTLGWLDDPILSTFVAWPRAELAGLIFHELTHAKLFIRDDVAFNEALATFVERQGVTEWLAALGDQSALGEASQRWQRTDQLASFLLFWRDELQRLYDALENSIAKRLLKAELVAELNRCYVVYAAALGAPGDPARRRRLNSADLIPVATYHEYVAAFAALFIASSGNWQEFFTRARQIGRLNPERRHAEIKAFAFEHGMANRPPERSGVICQLLTVDSAG